MLFDLDGTLSNSAPGILRSLRSAFAANALPPMTAEQERAVLGPPFYTSLPELVGADAVDAVIASYRVAYATAMFDTTLYDGIKDVVEWLSERGCVLAVATSKPEHYAVPIVEHLGLADCFATICGDTLDGLRGSKALVVGEALARLGGPDASMVLMVGDREHDVIGARAHDIGCLGAGWGYGSTEELTEAGALAVFAAPAQLHVALPGLFSG